MNGRAFILACLVVLVPWAADAHDYKLGAIHIDHPWARPTAGVEAGAAYLSLENTGGEADKLVSVSTPVAAKAEIHQTTNEGGVMKMREVADGVDLAPGATVGFKPGAYHIMLLKLKQKLGVGQHIPLTLTFAKAGSIDVEVYVEKSAGGDHEGGMPNHDMSHHEH